MNKFTLRRVMTMSFLMLLSTLTFAQTARLQGRVLDNEGNSVVGATVQFIGQQSATSTGPNGAYSFSNVSPGSYKVGVYMIGYDQAEQTINLAVGDNTLDFTLTSFASSLDEVVVIGYGTQKKGDLTGSLTTVSSKDFQKGLISSPEQLIAGKVAGVQITTSGGQPGGGATIRVRAGASLNASNDPLIVVDGVPLSTGEISGVGNPLSLINPNDIEIFTVLKDANATAIYGSRASNGVILITTKKGTSGKPSFNFSSQNSLAKVANKVDLLSADQIREYVNTEGNDAQRASLGDANTDWQDEIYREAFASDNNLSVAGAIQPNLPYRVSLGYLSQQGILKRDLLERTTAGINFAPKLFDNSLQIDINLKGSISNSQFANQDAIGAAIQFDPTKPVYTENRFGNYYEWTQYNNNTQQDDPNPNAPRNPVALIDLKDDNGKVARSFGNIQFDYALPFLPELHANLNLGYDVSRGQGSTSIPAYAASNINTLGEITRYKKEITNTVGEFYLNYIKDLTDIQSNINATAGYGYYDNRSKEYNFDRTSADGTVLSTPTFPFDIPHNRLISYYGRLIYTYADKYIFSGTVRTDGSSRFSEENRWGVFPSVGATWRIKEESFLKDNNTISDLKLRLSYGVTGQQDGIANYSYLPNYVRSMNESLYQFGNTFYNMYTPVAYDKNIRWESTATYNGGIDYGILNGRLSGSVDVYFKKTKDLLSTIPIPVGTNFSNLLLTNVGNMENKGVEFSLNGAAIRKDDLNLDLGFNFTYNHSKVTNLTAVDDPNYLVEQGGISGSTGNNIQAHVVNHVPYSYRVYRQVYAEDGSPLEGIYEDLNGDGIINDNDRYFYKSPLPTYLLGFTAQLNYKKWTLNTVLRSNIGNYVYDNVSSNFASRYNVLDPNGPINNAPTSFLGAQFEQKQYNSDYYIHNASFLKMDNLSLSYAAGSIFRNGGGRLTISANMQNVFTVSKYKGVDPEIDGGIDNRFYPRPRTYVLGVNLDF
ncbi:SusC/RagA family TonB-linked outer membrane protein [Sphingobacterium corticibacterium]|uniref:SusC/RagA family TonB-linked outer membrane protein n=2 Tax=Sphingobacterium corticibacterium TaxID=2484746 RepID=A0A4Q6XSW1_9SPHI|nr:SusC/RagA family TonB-linked outer membrane protein [Sphingobacterium corticibacterium]